MAYVQACGGRHTQSDSTQGHHVVSMAVTSRSLAWLQFDLDSHHALQWQCMVRRSGPVAQMKLKRQTDADKSITQYVGVDNCMKDSNAAAYSSRRTCRSYGARAQTTYTH